MTNPNPSAPWWRFPMVWLVIAGPAAVVVAGVVTAVIAVRGGDVPVREADAAPQARTMSPAALARNHAATARR
jgi:uncharacterized protein